MIEAKENLSDVDVEFENIFVFLILLILQSSDCKKPFRGFSEILIHKISYELHHFPYYDLTKKSAKKNIISFSGIPCWLRSIKNSAMRTTYYLVWVSRQRWSVGLINSNLFSKNKIIL